MDLFRKILQFLIGNHYEQSKKGMAVEIDLDGDKNNDGHDLTKKLIEKQIKEINKWQDIANNRYSAYDEAFRAAQSRVAMHDRLMKEAKENVENSHREELYRDASMIKPIRFVPVKKEDKLPVINITNPSFVFSGQKQPWYKNFLWQLFALVGSLLVALLAAYLVYRLGWN